MTVAKVAACISHDASVPSAEAHASDAGRRMPQAADRCGGHGVAGEAEVNLAMVWKLAVLHTRWWIYKWLWVVEDHHALGGPDDVAAVFGSPDRSQRQR